MLELSRAINRLSGEEQSKPIPCSRAPLAAGPERAALQQSAPRLASPAWRAVAYCLLGDDPAALAAYSQAASAGDGWSALQVYFLQARQGNSRAAAAALNGVQFSPDDLHYFISDVTALKATIDLLPIARITVQLSPTDPESWKEWLSIANQYQTASQWQPALDAYLEAIRLQTSLGVSVGRSSFELGAGRVYELSPGLRDLHAALAHINLALTAMDFLNPGEASSAYLYRGEVYQGLSTVFTPTQALQEFMHCLELDPKNYWALRAIASVYLYSLKDPASAETYINQAIVLNPDPYYAYQIRGDVDRQQGNLKAAAADYQAALARQPGDKTTLARLAAVQAELQKQSP